MVSTSTSSLLGDETLLPSNASQPLELTCKEYVQYVYELVRSYGKETEDGWEGRRLNRSITDAERRHYVISHVINGYAVPAVCMFGIIGNLLNLIVLTRNRLQRSMKHMERSVNNGLVSLALSDVFLCLVYLIESLYRGKLHHDSLPELYYRSFQEVFINFFLLTSTWLTMMMAVSRYIAVCHPLHARSFINQRGTRITIAGVWVGSFAVNLPRFWHYRPTTLSCDRLGLSDVVVTEDCHSCVYYEKLPAGLFGIPAFASAYTAIWTSVAILVPLITMVICNCCLVRALRRSSAMQKKCCTRIEARSNRAGPVSEDPVSDSRREVVTFAVRSGNRRSPSSAGHRITPTLVALVVLFLVLVGPSDMMTFAKNYLITHPSIRTTTNNTMATYSDTAAYFRFRSAVDITNCLLLVNFASNVVLYCAINAQFRRVLRHIFCGNRLTGFCDRTGARSGRGFGFTDCATDDGETVCMKPTQNTVVNFMATADDAAEL